MKEVTLFLLRGLLSLTIVNKDNTKHICEIINNKSNTDDYVYQYLYDNMNIIFAEQAEIILELLKENGRI